VGSTHRKLGLRMSTIAGKFRVKNVPIPKEVLDELARKLNLSDDLLGKLQGMLTVEKIDTEEYTIEVREGGQLLDTITTKL
jgi:hypothetical protein